jgi:hypothetical protein
MARENVCESDVAAFWRLDADLGRYRVPQRVLAPEVGCLWVAAVAFVDGVAGFVCRRSEGAMMLNRAGAGLGLSLRDKAIQGKQTSSYAQDQPKDSKPRPLLPALLEFGVRLLLTQGQRRILVRAVAAHPIPRARHHTSGV